MWSILLTYARLAGAASLGWFINDVAGGWFERRRSDQSAKIQDDVKKGLKNWQKYLLAGGAVLLASVVIAILFPVLRSNKK